MPPRASGLGTAIMALIGLSSLLVGLHMRGLQGQDLEFLGAKALVARHGPEPRMQAVGFVFSPVLVYGTLILGSPLVLQGLLGAVSVGLLARNLRAAALPTVWRWSWFGLIIVQPAFALMLLLSPTWTLSTALLIVVTSRLCALIQADYRSDAAAPLSTSALIIFGLVLAPLMLVRYEAWLLLPLIAGVWGFLYRRESWPFKATVVAITLFMSLVCIGAWLYVNWLFAGDPWCFLTCPSSGWRLPNSEPFIRQAGFAGGWVQAVAWVASVTPLYILMAPWILWRTPQRVLWTLILLMPLLFPAAALWQGSFTPQLSRFGMFLAVLPIFWRYYPPSMPWQRWMITCALLLGLTTNMQLLRQGQVIPEETSVWYALAGQSPPQTLGVQQWLTRQQSTQQMATTLLKDVRPDQQILTDEVVSYPLVYLVNDARRFIASHQYEFSPAIQHPDLFADFILVAGPQSSARGHDRLLQFWPQLATGGLPGFRELLTTPEYRLLRRATSAGN